MAREVPGSKRQRDQLRATMIEQGCTFKQIAAVFAQQWGFRQRQAWRHAYGWTQEHVADLYNQQLNNGQAPMNGKRIGDYENWPDSPVKPNPKVLRILAKIYSTSEYNLTDPYDRQKMTADELSVLKPPSTVPADLVTIGTNGNPSEITPPQSEPSFVLAEPPLQTLQNTLNVVTWGQGSIHSISDMVMSAARRSKHHYQNALGHAMSETTLEDLTDEVERLTKEHLYTDPASTFADTVQVRDRIYRLLELRQYPKQTTHLYYLASIVCALLADSSVCVGFPKAAEEQARASWAYAEIIGHNALRVDARRMQAAVAYWGKRPRHALEYSLSARVWATEPIAQAGLYSAIALYSASAGRPEEARAALAAAFDAHQSAPGDSEFFDRLGGMFTYDRANLFRDAAAIYRELGDTSNAQNSATESLRLYETAPPEQRASGTEASARIDLGHIRMLDGDGEGTAAALRPVLDLAPPERLDWLCGQLKDFDTALRGHGMATSTIGRQLGEEIEHFLGATAANSFPCPNGY